MLTKITSIDHLKKLAQRTKSQATELENKIKAIAIPEYTMTKQATAEAGYLSTYQLTKDGVAVGAKLNIPKDFLVKSATLETVETAGTPYSGAKVGNKYIDFVINSKEGTDSESHIYLPVNDLVDVYTGGNGIDVSAENVVSVKVDAANANGLSATADGLQLALATSSAAGAMSAEDKTKMDGLTFATDAEVDAMLTEVFGAEQAEPAA